jgi:uncharacterized coiled-coil protein SlyX
MSSSDYDQLARELILVNDRLADLEQRMATSEKVNARLEHAALNTARSMEEISRHWDAVYEAMRRAEKVDDLDDLTLSGE